MRSPLLLSVSALAALALVPAAAGAATVVSDGAGNYTYTAAPGEKNNMSLQIQDDASTVLFYSYGVKVTSVPAGCTVGDDGEDATCTGVKTAVVNLGDGDDSFARSGPTSILATVDGGDGADWLKGDVGADALRGGPGKDKLEGWKGNDALDGGDGDDEINGALGADTIQGGGGNDVISPDYFNEPMPDVVDGGPGIDTIESDYADYDLPVQLPLSFTMGGGADDGRPGENDDLRGIERMTLSISPTHYSGSEGDDYVKVAQATNPGELIGNGGNDDLNGADGSEKLDGGPGDDHLDGGFGDDVITGGPGRDRISGDLAGGDCGPLWCKYPYGNDVINAQDGEIDSILCGFGTDVVNADAADVVDKDCETVNRAGATPPPVTKPNGKTTDKPRIGGHAGLARKVTIAKALKAGFAIKVTGVAAAQKIALSATRSGKLVARGSAKADNKGTATITLRFTAKAKRSLRHARTIKLKVNGGGLSTTITLKRR
jgi:Ca2+-binding RTX toxin-like protein